MQPYFYSYDGALCMFECVVIFQIETALQIAVGFDNTNSDNTFIIA